MTGRETKYWIIVASKDHAKSGVSGRFAQACHGKSSQLARMKKGDFIISYSGKQTLGGTEKCQEFTSLGKVSDDEIYEVQTSPDFCPSR